MSWRADTWLASLLLVLAFPVAAAGQARPAAPAGGWIFDPAKVQTVEGEVSDVQRIPSGRRYEGVHLAVATAQETLDVHLGPEWYVDRNLPKLAKGDRVEVKGSRVTLDGKPALIAQEIRRGDARVTLRNEAGVPAWSRGGRR